MVLPIPLAAVLLVCLELISAYTEVVVRDNHNKTVRSYQSEAALFGPRLPEEGIAGHLMLAVPIQACSDVTPVQPNGTVLIALIKREACTFAKKVFNVQQAGYGAAIVYNVGSDDLVPMRGDGESGPISIPSVFVGETSGLALAQLALNFTVLLKERNSHSFFIMPFTIVFPLCALIMCLFFCIRCVLEQVKKKRLRLSKSNLKKLPIRKFKKGDKYEVCAVCLEEYEDGDKLRELPCAHAYHQKCIDPWLTKNKQTCPLCNKKVFPTDDGSDAENGNEENRLNENTPLLTSRGNTMSDYGISVASRSNDGHTDSSSDGSLSESPDEAPPSHVVSRAEVHAKPRVFPASAGRELDHLPSAASATNGAGTGGASGCVVARENAGFDLSENHFGAEANVTEDGPAVVAAASDPLLVDVCGADLPSRDVNRIV